jgi:quercetin dioxygenase-like cupin family protein
MTDSLLQLIVLQKTGYLQLSVFNHYQIKLYIMRSKSSLDPRCLSALAFLILSLTPGKWLRAQQTATNSTAQQAGKPALINRKAGEPAFLPYDYGQARFLVDSATTHGAWSLVEVIEQPGYKTPIHRHNDWDESFYVLEGTLTAKVGDSVQVFPAGSYVLIPRGTAHAQGNFASVPVRLLLSITPSGFEGHIKGRVELHKTIKPDNPQFQMKLDSLRKKNAKYIEFLGPWDTSKK